MKIAYHGVPFPLWEVDSLQIQQDQSLQLDGKPRWPWQSLADHQKSPFLQPFITTRLNCQSIRRGETNKKHNILKKIIINMLYATKSSIYSYNLLFVAYKKKVQINTQVHGNKKILRTELVMMQADLTQKNQSTTSPSKMFQHTPLLFRTFHFISVTNGSFL